MFAVKSTYSIKTPSSLYTPFDTYLYVANDEVYFKTHDIASEIRGSIFDFVPVIRFENYVECFARKVDWLQLFADKPEVFKHRDFWSDVFANTDFLKVIAEVRNAQQFVKEYFRLDLPEDWYRYCLNVDAVIANLPVKATEWIEKCHNSLRILATNDEQKEDARRVFDEAWKILKEREKDATTDKRPTVHDTLAKFGLTDDDLINAILERHQNKFREQRGELEAELRRILK